MARKIFLIFTILIVLSAVLCLNDARAAQERTRLRTQKRGALHVVTTLPDYAVLTKAIGGDRIEVECIVHSVQDPHHIRPKPSFISMVMDADVLISTGLDLEMWLPTVIDKSGNKRVRSGEIGHVAVAQGINLIEKPKVISQAEGDVHVFGNPHITTSPINAKQVAWNIATGLIKNDQQGKDFYEENLKKLLDEIDKHLFGEELVKLLGGDTLCRLADNDKLIDFLQQNKLEAKPLIDRLGGWMKKMMPMRGTPVVVYHKDWSYLLRLFGIEEVGDVEPKPGIPPSLKHVAELIDMMREKNIHIIISANYFDEQKTRSIADRTGAKAVIVPLFVGGAPGVDNYFQLVDYWTDELLKASKSP